MPFNVNDAFALALSEHGVSISRQDEQILVSEKQLILSTAIFPKPGSNATLIQLDIRLQSPLIKKQILIESFAGYGKDIEEASSQAFYKFLRGSFHVLMAIFIRPELHSIQVEWETWEADHIKWKICMGPLLTQIQDSGKLNYGDLLDQFKEKLPSSLEYGYHWFRIFYMQNNGKKIGVESLLDNNQWQTGIDILNNWKWPDGDYSIRHFLFLMPE